MGLERLAAILQHVHSNYEIDLFDQLIKAAAAARPACRPGQPVAEGDCRPHPRLRLPGRDGVIPGNEGRGYVLRRIVRRAIRHGYKLGAEDAVLPQAGGRPGAPMGEPTPNCARAEPASPRC
jgi:alanyl-tRNA synthetase